MQLKWNRLTKGERKWRSQQNKLNAVRAVLFLRKSELLVRLKREEEDNSIPVETEEAHLEETMESEQNGEKGTSTLEGKESRQERMDSMERKGQVISYTASKWKNGGEINRFHTRR